MNCRARQYSDQMICHTCGLAWDMNDPEPPKCKLNHKVLVTFLAARLACYEPDADILKDALKYLNGVK